MEMSMTILFVAWGTLFAAVIARSMFEPWPAATDETQHQANINGSCRAISLLIPAVEIANWSC
jgi:hypothetical protein